MTRTVVSSLQQMLSEMDAALATEIKAQENGGKSGGRIAIDGKPLEVQDVLHLYTYFLKEPWEVGDDTPVRVQINNNPSINATIVTSNGASVTISTQQPLTPDALQQIMLFDDSIELLKYLKIALNTNEESNSHLGSKTFRLENPREGIASSSIPSTVFQPDDAQEKAIQMALGSEVTYIVGPPGTGKTVTLATIALEHLLAGRTVLITAHTNIAVDNAIKTLADHCDKAGAKSFLQEEQVIRFGTVENHSDIRQAKYEDIYLPALIKRHSAHLQHEQEQLEASKKYLEAQLMALTCANEQKRKEWAKKRQQLIVQHTTCTDKWTGLQKSENQRITSLSTMKTKLEWQREQLRKELLTIDQSLSECVSREAYLQNKHLQSLTRQRELSARLISAQQMNIVMLLFKGINRDKLAKNLLDVKPKLWENEQELQKLQVDMARGYSYRSALQKQVQVQTTQINSIIHLLNTPSNTTQTIAELEKIRESIHYQLVSGEEQIEQGQSSEYKTNIANIDLQLDKYRELLRGLEKSIVAKARVVATTLSKTYMSSMLNDRRFDVVIIDEVSMAPLPAIYIAASRANSSVVAVGDPQQLAPIYNAKNDKKLSQTELQLAKSWLGTDLFISNNITFEKVKEGYRNSIILTHQSRMHPDISTIARKHVYAGLLQDKINRVPGEQLSQVEPVPGKHLLLCDTHDASPFAIRPDSNSRINIYHAICSVAIARQAYLTLPQDHKLKGKPQIGLVTPYKKQAKLLQSLINDAGLKEQIRVGTVHKFQGLEFDVVIFDTVESPDIRPRIDFIAGGKNTEALRLVNVAITRAKHKLIIVANARHIQTTRDKKSYELFFPENSILRKAVEEAQQVGVVNSLDLLDLSIQSSSEALEISSKSYTKFQPHVRSNFKQLEYEHLDDRTFFDRLSQDMQLARKKIVIFSPFFSPQRLEQIKPMLIERHQLGIDVVVFSSNVKQYSYYPQAINDLKQAGIKHQTFSGRHDKLAIIDTGIVYLGSLNTLSHFGTIDYMLRIKSPTFVETLCKFIDLETMETAPLTWGADFKISIDRLLEIPCTKCNQLLKPIPGKYGVFYGHRSNRRCNHTEDIPETVLRNIPDFSNVRCEKCGGQTKLSIVRKDSWLSCDASEPCQIGWKIVIE